MSPVTNTQTSNVLARAVRRHGNEFIASLCGLLRVARVHGKQHQKTVDAAKGLLACMRQLSGKDGDVTIEVREAQIHLNDVRLRTSADGSEPGRLLIDTLRKHGIACLSFDLGLTTEALLGLACALHDTAARAGDDTITASPTDALAQLQQALAAQQITTISVASATGTCADALPGRERALETYRHVIEALREVQATVKERKPLSVRRTKRAMHMLVEVTEEDESLVLGLTTVKGLASYELTHPVNTAILAVAMGGHLQLPRKLVSELGLAALFLDLGMLALDEELVQQPRALTEDERCQLQRHPIDAAKVFLAGEPMVDVTIRCLRTSFEHHRGFDRTGYPRVAPEQANSLLTEIVSICDTYDAVTSARPYRPAPMTPTQAHALLLDGAGTKFDPRLVKVFVRMMGAYPVGTIVRLNTAEIATVQRGNQDLNLIDRPKVKVFANSDGRFQERIVDLAEQDPDGQFLYWVEQVLNPSDLGLELGNQLAVL